MDLPEANRLVVHGFYCGIVPFGKESRDEGMREGGFPHGTSSQDGYFAVDKCRAVATIAVAAAVGHDGFRGKDDNVCAVVGM